MQPLSITLLGQEQGHGSGLTMSVMNLLVKNLCNFLTFTNIGNCDMMSYQIIASVYMGDGR